MFHDYSCVQLNNDTIIWGNLICIYIYIYIYIVLFGPVKPELGVIPSGQENHSGAEHLNFPGWELNVIDFTEQYFFKEKSQRPVFGFFFKDIYIYIYIYIYIERERGVRDSEYIYIYIYMCVCVYVCVCVCGERERERDRQTDRQKESLLMKNNSIYFVNECVDVCISII